MSVEVAEGLERAAQYIRERGWTRGEFEHAVRGRGGLGPPVPGGPHVTAPGRICLVRALELAADVAGPWLLEEWSRRRTPYLALYHAVEAEVGTDRLSWWNDEVASSRAEVLRVLRAAAWRARKEED